MPRIDDLLSRIPAMPAASRKTLRQNAEAKLAREPGDMDARRVIVALDAAEPAFPATSAFEVTGRLAWEKHRPGAGTFRAFHGDTEVGRIFKRADHSTTERDVYSLEILGQPVPGAFHHISDAREAGERAFGELHP